MQATTIVDVPDTCHRSGSSLEDMPILMDSFELERCCDSSHCRSFEFADTERWLPPPPQKFPSPASKADGKTSRYVDHVYAVHYKQRFCRAVGAMIALEEPARWASSDGERESSALMVAEGMS